MPSRWITATDAKSIAENDGIAVEVNQREIAIFHGAEGFYAIDNKCTHAAAPLVDGYLADGVIECPLHQGLFCIKSGKALASPATRDLRRYEVRVVDGEVQVKID